MTTTRTPLTDTTWATIGNEITPDTRYSDKPLYWTDKCDLEHQLTAGMGWTGTPDKRAESLITAAASGLPVRIVWDAPFGEDRIERTDAVVTIEHLTYYPATATNPGNARMRVHYLAFGHDVYLSSLRFAELVFTKTTFHDADNAPEIVSNNPTRP